MESCAGFGANVFYCWKRPQRTVGKACGRAPSAAGESLRFMPRTAPLSGLNAKKIVGWTKNFQSARGRRRGNPPSGRAGAGGVGRRKIRSARNAAPPAFRILARARCAPGVCSCADPRGGRRRRRHAERPAKRRRRNTPPGVSRIFPPRTGRACTRPQSRAQPIPRVQFLPYSEKDTLLGGLAKFLFPAATLWRPSAR